MEHPPPRRRAVTGRPPPAPAGGGRTARGITVLDLATVGPAARATRVLADYGATVVKVGAVPGRGAAAITPPFYAYSGSATSSARPST